MRRNSILVIITLVMILCISQASAAIEADPGDEITDISRSISGISGETGEAPTFISIGEWKENSGLYFHMAFSGVAARVFLFNSTIYQYYMDGGRKINSTDALFVTANAVNISYDMIIPYDEHFYFYIGNQLTDDLWMQGWFARDITGPNGTIWGLVEGQRIEKGETLNIGCYFEADRFNVSRFVVGLDIYPMQDYGINTGEPYNWSVELYTGNWHIYGNTYINFTAVDFFGNHKSTTMNIYFVDPNATTPTPPPNPFMIGAIVGAIGLFSIFGAVNHYRGMKEAEIEKQRKKEKEHRPYHKGHRDSKKYRKRKKRWDA